MSIFNASPADLGQTVQFDQTPTMRTIEITGDYPSPFWVKFDDDSSMRIDALPATIVRKCSSIVILPVQPPSAPPPAPTNVQANLSGTTATVTATDASSGGADHELWVKRSDETAFVPLQRVLRGQPITFSHTGLLAGFTYTYRVFAMFEEFEPDLYSLPSEEKSVTVPSTPTPPTAPGIGLSGVGTSNVTVTVTDNSDNEGSFEIHRSTVNGFAPTVSTRIHTAASLSGTGGQIIFSDSGPVGGFVQGTRYYYVALAINAGGTTPSSQVFADIPVVTGGHLAPVAQFVKFKRANRWIDVDVSASAELGQTNATLDTITKPGHGYQNGDTVMFFGVHKNGSNGIKPRINYFVRDVTADTFKVAATAGGVPVDITSTLAVVVRNPSRPSKLVNFQINWGDGSPVSNSSTPTVFSHQYPDETVRNLSLTVTQADGQTHTITYEVRPKTDNSPDFYDDFSSGTRAPDQRGIGYRNLPAKASVVSGKVAIAPSTFACQLEFPACAHGNDLQTATEQRMFSSEQLNEKWVERWVWFPDGTEPWGENRYFHRTQGGETWTGCSISAGNTVLSTTSTKPNEGHGATDVPSPGRELVVGTAYTLQGTLTSNGTNIIQGSGTAFTQQLAVNRKLNYNGGVVTVQSIQSDTQFTATAVIAAASNITADVIATIVSVNRAVSPIQVTMSIPALNTVSNITAVMPSEGPENNKFMISWDENPNYSGDVQMLLETLPSGIGDSSVTYKTSWAGWACCGTKNKILASQEAGSIGSHSAVGAGDRGRWVRYRHHVRMSVDLDSAGTVSSWKDDALIWTKLTANPLCADPRGNNYFRSWYTFGWSNSGYNKLTRVFLGKIAIYTVNPGW